MRADFGVAEIHAMAPTGLVALVGWHGKLHVFFLGSSMGVLRVFDGA